MNHDIRNVWYNPTLFKLGNSIENNMEKGRILTQLVEKSFPINPLNTSNAIYHDSFNFKL